MKNQNLTVLLARLTSQEGSGLMSEIENLTDEMKNSLRGGEEGTDNGCTNNGCVNNGCVNDGCHPKPPVGTI